MAYEKNIEMIRVRVQLNKATKPRGSRCVYYIKLGYREVGFCNVGQIHTQQDVAPRQIDVERSMVAHHRSNDNAERSIKSKRILMLILMFHLPF